jgi:ABC-type phosphate transport system substrate-binding protein
MKRIAAFVLLLCVASAAHAEVSFKVIVHPDLNVASLSVPVLSDVFMKKVRRWSNGVVIVPVDQSSKIRDDFSRAVHGKTANAVKIYWAQEIYSGRGVPPLQKTSDEQVIAFVKSTPGAIGYVSDKAVTDGVRVVPISPGP